MTENILALLAGLAGLGGLISVLVNLLKIFGVVQDGTSEQWVQGLNFVAFIAVSIVYFLGVQVNWTLIDGVLIFATTLLGFVIQLFGSQATYFVIKGIPVIGFSFNED